jgi:O-methyltransferase
MPIQDKMYKKLIRRVMPARTQKILSILNRIRRLPKDQLSKLDVEGFGMQGEPFTFQEDGLSCIHNCDFLQDPEFKKAYGAGCETGSWGGWPLRWRAYVVCWCARWASRLPSDFVECGVNRGGNARMLIEHLKFPELKKRFLLFDTFKGFPSTHLLPEERQIVSKYEYPDCLEKVRQTFRGFPYVSIIAGAVPETLAMDDTEQVSFLSIDMNCVKPEIAAAEHFWSKLVPNGVIVLDDYGFTSHLPQKRAFDDFAERRGTSVLSLPTGQGLIFKQNEWNLGL